MIKAVLIDDDVNLREGTKGLLSLYAPDVEIIGEAGSVETGVKIINLLQPQVIFLDIQMNDGTGFDLLEKLFQMNGKLNSHVVFVTAYEQYAVKAFHFSALDFLLKPVGPDELEKVVDKIRLAVGKDTDYSHIDLLLENIRTEANNYKRIALINSDGMHLLDISEIIRCESIDGFTNFYLQNKKPILILKAIKEYEELLSENDFVRIHSNHLINLAFVKLFTKKNKCKVIMCDLSELPVAERKAEYLLGKLMRK